MLSEWVVVLVIVTVVGFIVTCSVPISQAMEAAQRIWDSMYQKEEKKKQEASENDALNLSIV